MKSHSQFGEDLAAAALFAFPYAGRVLEIGAYDPVTFSNSRMFIEQGWQGLLIDCSPSAVKALATFYESNADVDIIQAAVVLPDGPGLLKMQLTDDAVSTSDAEQHERWKNTVTYYGRAWMATITLEQISLQFGGFDLISIDVEGGSVDLFTHAVANLHWEPRCWIVEFDNRLPELLSVATKCGYKAIHSNGTNVVLAK